MMKNSYEKCNYADFGNNRIVIKFSSSSNNMLCDLYRMYIYRIKKIITKNNIMTIQDKLRKKGFQLGVTFIGGIRTGYYATNRAYGTKTRIYKTQIELLNAIK